MDAERRLRSRGYRLTPQRRAVLEALAGEGGRPLDTSQIHKRVSREFPGIGLATVYRTLELLVELGIALPVHLHEGSRHYELNTGEHRHHLVCLSCGEVQPFRGCDPGELAERVRDESDFLVTSHCLSLFGICGSCRSPGRGR